MAEIWADTGCDNELLFKAVVGQIEEMHILY